MYRIGIDIGGAFTDLVAIDENGNMVSVKVDTTREQAEGVMNSVRASGIDLRQVRDIIHGHTVVINSIVQRDVATVGLVTTKGFRDVLEIQRSNRRDIYNLRYRKPEPFVPRYLRLEVDGRLDATGSEVTPLALDGLSDISQKFREHGVKSVAVSFINSYANPQHERLAGERIRQMGFEYVTLSSEVSGEWREYERTSTAVLNAAVQPKVDSYLNTLERFFRDSGFRGNFFIMSSNGGLSSTQHMRNYPIYSLESGPVSGVMGAISLVRQCTGSTRVDIITLDGGSTTTKSSLVSGSEPRIVTDYHIGRDRFNPGYPVRVPVVDIVEVGSGGTSIAYVEDGRLRVGPRASGAYPGPACYGRGGTEPTLTDAYVVNGFIDPSYFLGGRIRLERKLAEEAIQALADRLSMGANETAEGIINLGNENAAFAIRLVSVQRGYDPRDFTLVPFGGAGPMMAPFIADELQISRIMVPCIPLGVFSAWGMLTADVRHEKLRTVVATLEEGNLSEIESAYREMEEEMVELFRQEGYSGPTLARYADMRYVGQEHTLKVPMPPSIGTGNLGEALRRFHSQHEREYTFKMEGNPVEIVNLHVVGMVSASRVKVPEVEREGSGRPKAHRKVFLAGSEENVPVYDRKEIPASTHVQGPCIVEEETATIVVLEGQRVHADRFGNLIVERESVD
ncbi:hydantoinase/oxoprolinase family protein [Thermogymnomonas acidicola]|nr:hydantoinase/oxoprolinase family protein [Thermogymnomonas acidicola]